MKFWIVLGLCVVILGSVEDVIFILFMDLCLRFVIRFVVVIVEYDLVFIVMVMVDVGFILIFEFVKVIENRMIDV